MGIIIKCLQLVVLVQLSTTIRNTYGSKYDFKNFEFQLDQFGYPIDELGRIRKSFCQDNRVGEETVDKVLITWRDCIQNLTERTQNSHLIKIPRICSESEEYKLCYKEILQILNDCDSNRGDIAGKLYFQEHKWNCQHFEEFDQEVTSNSSYCYGQSYDITLSRNSNCFSNDDWTSKDMCKRINFREDCWLSFFANQDCILGQMIRQRASDSKSHFKCVQHEDKLPQQTTKLPKSHDSKLSSTTTRSNIPISASALLNLSLVSKLLVVCLFFYRIPV